MIVLLSVSSQLRGSAPQKNHFPSSGLELGLAHGVPIVQTVHNDRSI